MPGKADELKKEVVFYSHLLDEKGLVNTLEGNISILDRETGELYITPSGIRKSFLNEDLIAVMRDGEQIDGGAKRSSEYLLHLAALKARPDCAAVAHVHSPYLTAYAYCGQDIRLKCSATFSLVFEEIPCLPYGEAGTVHIADGIEDAIKEHDLILLGNHGCVAVGRTMEDAVKLIETAEEVLRIYHLAKSIGEVKDIPEDKLRSLCENHPSSRRNRCQERSRSHVRTSQRHVRLGDDGASVVILDQTLLPNRVEYLTLREPEEMFEAIRLLRVRGAPAIGIFAGYCLAALAEQRKSLPPDQFGAELHRLARHLNSSRPTAVNLSWALNRLEQRARAMPGADPASVAAALREEAAAIHREDIAMCRAISEFGLTLLKDGCGVLTHCNAGALATSQYGTALGPLLLGKERGMRLRVFADETRPLLQGARLTAYELHRAGVDVTLICDNMASMVMKNGWVDACFVGCDRVAANGDAANKIGTSGVAILARHYGVPFYVLGPTSTIDLNCPSGDDIQIELRDPEEIRSGFYAQPMAPAGVKCYNPAFDVTDHSLITGIVTEKGICRPPYTKSLAALFR